MPLNSAPDDEISKARGRRKFTAGALEQAAQILGAISASVLVAGLVGPYIAALTGSSQIPEGALGAVSTLALAISFVSAGAAMLLRGLSRRANDDGETGRLGRDLGRDPAP